MKVYLSPSTQEKNVGFGSYGTEESVMNRIADVVQEILAGYKIEVYRNHREMNVAQAVEQSNYLNVDIHVALHSNANDKISRGCEVFCHKRGGEGERLSQFVYDKLSKITPTSDRGVKEGYNFYSKNNPIYELKHTKAPATLVEIAFHDNKDDSVWILDNIYLIGKTIADSILEYLNVVVHVDKSQQLVEENKQLKEKIIELEKEQKRLERIVIKTREYIKLLKKDSI